MIAAGFDAGTTDGLNEAGLMVNLLYLAEADFGGRDASRPGVSWSAYSQYLLDNFATVAEAVAASRDDVIQVVASPLPGTRRATDRFVRASYYVTQLPDPQNDRQAMANIMSVMRNASVPFSNSDPSTPNISTTIWRTAADHINKVYYFESPFRPASSG